MIEHIDGQLTHKPNDSVWSACCCATLQSCTPYTKHSQLGSSGESLDHAQKGRYRNR